MLDFLARLIGLGLMIGGIGFLASSVVLGTFTLAYLPASGSVLLCIAGILTLTKLPEYRSWGWILITVGVVISFVSGGIIVTSTSLLSFLLAFSSLSVGYQLFSTGRIRF
jgi:hypothetical protein